MDKERARRLFLTAFFLFALANGLSGSIISNYFKDVFQVDSVQRGLLEIPRELPGVVGVFVIAALPSLGNVSLSVLGFALYCVGLLVLGLFSPGYFVMQLFVFTYSLGDHMVSLTAGFTWSCLSATPSPWTSPTRARRVHFSDATAA